MEAQVVHEEEKKNYEEEAVNVECPNLESSEVVDRSKPAGLKQGSEGGHDNIVLGENVLENEAGPLMSESDKAITLTNKDNGIIEGETRERPLIEQDQNLEKKAEAKSVEILQNICEAESSLSISIDGTKGIELDKSEHLFAKNVNSKDPPVEVMSSQDQSSDNCPESSDYDACEPSGSSDTGGACSVSTLSKLPVGDPLTTYYYVKWINWKGERTPVIMQSENGPCPLLAIMNILFLRWKVKLPPQTELITTEELMAHLGECILSIKPRENQEGVQLNFQQNMSDAMAVLPKLSTGLDVNVRFTGVSHFEYTPECIMFDLLDIPLYHGWLVDPQSPEVVQAVGKLSYNQLVEKVITCKHSSDNSIVTEGLIAEQFLESTASQLTYHGLCELTSTAKEGELSAFFRNNHFSTMVKNKGHLYLLVTDQGFLHAEKVVWESLHNVDGDSCFCDAEFHLSHTLEKEVDPCGSELQRQIDQQQGGPSTVNDLELARQLQQEEYQQQQQQQQQPQQHQQVRQQVVGRQSGETRQRQKQDSECCIL
ncbi:ubiquitin carboxyl-terminal hydrolase MINDY-1 isoform X2 [Protopterus annectens]|uniref:ubiquitin carboxyl-terminal hydrolase MINDY-1 isoform X2 n=1 Tax=Protopterus annectens TaxID=7888 RepID=UPI001CF930DE|nr:ubiquitin carboxyl-terminal hydrolase MINDY-1 isoform X2 [Protopterus annectens]